MMFFIAKIINEINPVKKPPKEITANLKNLCAYIQVKSLLSDVEDWRKLERDLDVLIDEDTRIARLSHTRATSDTAVD
jgi:hypothetical protein